jgi:predicted aminopeptidase
VKCARALARWRDYQRFSGFLDPFVAELEALYGDTNLTTEEKVARRESVFDAALVRFAEQVAPELEQFTFASFRETPLNNATLLSRIRYYNRLADFDAFLASHDGDLVAALADLKARAGGVDAPFDLLPTAPPPGATSSGS